MERRGTGRKRKNCARRRAGMLWGLLAAVVVLACVVGGLLLRRWREDGTIVLRQTSGRAVTGGSGQANGKEAETDVSKNLQGEAQGEETQTPKEDGIEDWMILVVNHQNPLPEGYEVSVQELGGGQAVDVRCYEALQEMLADCREAGLEPLVCSSYRTWEKQESLFQNKLKRVKEEGYTGEEALRRAYGEVAMPGTSEHQLGLALDIVDADYQNLEEEQEDTPVQRWLLENSWKYGFVLRYPQEKSEITGIIYEPWHYRYVGRKAAKEIYEAGICLEEYAEQKKSEM